jgi:hypothetical protein
MPRCDVKAYGTRRNRDSLSHLIEARIAALNDCRGATLALVRALIKQDNPTVVETR